MFAAKARHRFSFPLSRRYWQDVGIRIEKVTVSEKIKRARGTTFIRMVLLIEGARCAQIESLHRAGVSFYDTQFKAAIALLAQRIFVLSVIMDAPKLIIRTYVRANHDAHRASPSDTLASNLSQLGLTFDLHGIPESMKFWALEFLVGWRCIAPRPDYSGEPLIGEHLSGGVPQEYKLLMMVKSLKVFGERAPKRPRLR